ncbi:class I SAM-dependent RNA methyltransferase [Microbacterium sp. No. 7]|uniref:class I SAM-dependent RNA methyltransferase n=1 Tax=Microbacterium sp. No. 7 TaxID=1714373 RepID=UPI0006CFB80C|nr:class I SAM-dependent RNA methyltransferase [Microbacterium sp. No. 7]ALJ19362.1 23S rRNA methyltransferase [Microbacterium sp. No. 7]
MDAADIIELDVTGAAHGGVFVGRHGADAGSGADAGGAADAERGADAGSGTAAGGAARGGRVVFVPDAIPGERVRVRLTDTSKRSFWRGEVLDVLTRSPHRRPHVWAAADVGSPPERRPGGADFGHIDLAHQRALKARIVGEALQRFAGIDVDVTVEPVAGESADGTGWRTRVSLHVDDDGRIGPYAARSHRVVEVDELPLATAAIERAALRDRHVRPGRLDLVQPADGRVRVIPRAETPGGPRRGGRRPAPVDPAAREVVTEVVGDREFRVDAGGFWQVHRAAPSTLTDAVTAAAGDVDPDAWHLDLYGGVGLLAAALAARGGASTRVTTVESDPRATEHAGENLAEWIGARAETGRVDRWLAQLDAAATATQRARLARGVVVLDPPRAGAGGDVVRRLAALAPARVVYVACDPVALARDVQIFAAHGYGLASVRGLDLFPHSHHVEAVAVLTRQL